MKSIFGPCGKRLGLSARRAETAQKARFPRYSETGRTAPPPRIRPVNTERVEIVFQGWRAKYPHPRHEASRRREMRFHRVIISLESRISLERRRGARRDAFGNCGPPQVCLGSLRRGENPCEARAADAPRKKRDKGRRSRGRSGPARPSPTRARPTASPNRCASRMECQRRGGCIRCLYDGKRLCKFCRQCNPHCPAFVEQRCGRLERPPFVCNGCAEERTCVLRKRHCLRFKKPASTIFRTIVGSPIDIASCDLLATKVNARSCATRGYKGHGAIDAAIS